MKDRKTYKLLSYLGLIWLMPINRMYLGERFILRIITVNWFGIGAIADLFYTDKRFDEAMAKRGYFSDRGLR